MAKEGPQEGVTQYGANKYLWGNVPALDILNTKQNEGDKLGQKLALLFAGEFFWRACLQEAKEIVPWLSLLSIGGYQARREDSSGVDSFVLWEV